MSYPCVCVLLVHNISYFTHLLLNFFFSFQLSGFHPFCFCLCFVPHSGAIMFASAYFRREGFDTGSCDCPGAPGAGTPKAAATSPLVCCVKTSGTFWVTLAKQKDLKTLLPMQCIQTHRALFSGNEFPWFLTGMFYFISPFFWRSQQFPVTFFLLPIFLPLI